MYDYQPMKQLNPYPQEIEDQMINLYHSLTEKDRRRYAAIEASKLGYGGISYVCRIFKCDESGVKRGMEELTNRLLSQEPKRIRHEGAGRKSKVETLEKIDDTFMLVMSNHTAGSPMDETIKWSNLSRSEIAEELKKRGYPVSVTVVDQLLKKHDFRPRKAFKNIAGKRVEHRDEQFQNIEKIVAAAKKSQSGDEHGREEKRNDR
jgi:hypothetical protein